MAADSLNHLVLWSDFRRGVVLTLSLAFMTTTTPAGAEPEAQQPLRYFEGQVGGRFAFHMVLHQEGKQCRGSYTYRGKREPISLLGACDAQRWRLTEWESADGVPRRATANTITAQLGDGKIKGQWQAGRNAKALSFEATAVEPTRSGMLGQARGPYRLRAITGFFGANTMTDIWHAGKRWKASASAISAGMREGFDVGLHRGDQALLDSFQLDVDDALNIEVRVKGQRVVWVPYAEQPAFAVTRISRADGEVQGIYDGEAHSNFNRFGLHIVTTDALELGPLLSFENIYFSQDAPLALSLEYNPMTAGFEMRVISGQCCDAAALFFSPKR